MKKINDETIEELVRLHTNENLSATECAEALGISVNSAVKYLRRRGVYTNSRGGVRNE